MPEDYYPYRPGGARVGNPERETTIVHLNHAFAHGYLHKEELDERVDKAFGARFMTDLRALVGDLPGVPEPKSHMRLKHPVQTYKAMEDEGKALVWTAVFVAAVAYTVVLSVWAHFGNGPHFTLVAAMEQAFALVTGLPVLVGAAGRALYVATEGT